MDFNTYQNLAGRTSNKYLRQDWRLACAALGITGEAGEVADNVKKHLGHGHDLNREELIKELGDVLWYVAELSTLLGEPMSEIAERNIRKLKKRYPEGFSEERSINREE